MALAGHRMAETDMELGANLMVFFCRDWAELPEVPHLDRLVPDLGPLVDRLQAAEANQYRIFRFDEGGAIRRPVSCSCAWMRIWRRCSADTLALSQAVQTMLLWSDRAFLDRSRARWPLLESGAHVR